MSAMWTPEEAGRLLANRVTQPHYVEAIVRKCIANALASKEAETIERCAKFVESHSVTVWNMGPPSVDALDGHLYPDEQQVQTAMANAIRALGKGS